MILSFRRCSILIVTAGDARPGLGFCGRFKYSAAQWGLAMSTNNAGYLHVVSFYGGAGMPDAPWIVVTALVLGPTKQDPLALVAADE